MTTISICNDITATLSNRKAEQYDIAMRATESRHIFETFDESFDWEDYEDFCFEEFEAWERFFS
jgi:hypothetical protein